MLEHTKLPWTLLSYAATTEPLCTLYATLHPTDLRCTLLNYTAPSELRCLLTEIPPYIKLFRMQKCQAASCQFGIRMKRSADAEPVG
jgi:hypothetical protein